MYFFHFWLVLKAFYCDETPHDLQQTSQRLKLGVGHVLTAVIAGYGRC